jgi:hypothetical protein
MVTYREGLLTSLRGVACSLFSGSEQWGRKIARVFPPAALASGLSGAIAGLVCDKDPTTYPPLVVPPFSGGQCPVAYLVNYSYTRLNPNNGNPTVTTEQQVFTGPINGIEIRTAPATGTSLPSTSWQVWILKGSGNVQVFSTNYTNSSFGGIIDPAINTVSRTDGQPDNCGDVPPNLGNDSPISIPDVPVIWDDPDNGPTTLNHDVVIYSPYVLQDNSLNVSVKIGELFGDLEIFPNFRFSPRINFGGNGSDSLDCGTEPSVPEDEAPEVPLQFNPRILGVFVVSSPTGLDKTTSVFQDNVPTVHVPRVAQVFFGFADSEKYGWLGQIDVTLRRQYVPCPLSEGAQNVRVVWANGWSGSFSRRYEAPPLPEDEPLFELCGLPITPA